jgi:hypothetical protein
VDRQATDDSEEVVVVRVGDLRVGQKRVLDLQIIQVEEVRIALLQEVPQNDVLQTGKKIA